MAAPKENEREDVFVNIEYCCEDKLMNIMDILASVSPEDRHRIVRCLAAFYV